jgi:hypothetical protein
MIRSNVDVIAVSVLIAAAALFSAAQQFSLTKGIMVREILASRAVVFERSAHTSAVKVVRQLPVFSCVRD